jgi:DNA-binding transcriptional MerR regulator
MWWIVVAIVGISLYVASMPDSRRAKKGVQIENIRAQLMLLSADPKEIEAFLLGEDLPYITQELITQLIARIVELKLDNTIANDDDFLKKRIANLEDEESANFGEAMLKRGRKSR